MEKTIPSFRQLQAADFRFPLVSKGQNLKNLEKNGLSNVIFSKISIKIF